MNKKKMNLIAAAIILLIVGGYFGYQFYYQTSTAPVADSAEGQVFSKMTITRTELDTEFEDLQAVLMSAKATPFRPEGQESETIIGFQITEIQPNSFWSKFGFMDGDVITQINGSDLNSATAAMSLYSGLTSSNVNKYEFKILRNNVSGTLEISVK